MEKKMETIGFLGYLFGLYRDNGKEHGNSDSTLGLYSGVM